MVTKRRFKNRKKYCPACGKEYDQVYSICPDDKYYLVDARSR